MAALLLTGKNAQKFKEDFNADVSDSPWEVDTVNTAI